MIDKLLEERPPENHDALANSVIADVKAVTRRSARSEAESTNASRASRKYRKTFTRGSKEERRNLTIDIPLLPLVQVSVKNFDARIAGKGRGTSFRNPSKDVNLIRRQTDRRYHFLLQIPSVSLLLRPTPSPFTTPAQSGILNPAPASTSNPIILLYKELLEHSKFVHSRPASS